MSSEEALSCHCCGTQTTKACSRCVDRVYCSDACQREDWNVHREECVETTDVEGALDKLRGRTNFQSIFPDFFLAVWGYAVAGKTKDALTRGRLQGPHEKKITDILTKRLKVTRRKIRGAARLTAQSNAKTELEKFWAFVKNRVDRKDTTAFEEFFFQSIRGTADDFHLSDEDYGTLVAYVANAVEGDRPEKTIKKTSKDWGRKLDKSLDKR